MSSDKLRWKITFKVDETMVLFILLFPKINYKLNDAILTNHFNVTSVANFEYRWNYYNYNIYKDSRNSTENKQTKITPFKIIMEMVQNWNRSKTNLS